MLAIGYAATIFFHNLTHESTDDAFIDAHIVSIAPKIAGKISAVKVNDNQFVKKGQILLEIDPSDIEATVAQKRAALEVAQARLENARLAAEQAKAHVQTLLAAYASAQASTAAAAAETAKGAWRPRRGTGICSRAARFPPRTSSIRRATRPLRKRRSSRREKQLQAAAAYAEEGKKQAGSAHAQASAAQAEVAEAQAELRQAELQESYTKITAPEAGRVTNKSIEPGDYVQVGPAAFCDCAAQGLGDREFQGNAAH